MTQAESQILDEKLFGQGHLSFNMKEFSRTHLPAFFIESVDFLIVVKMIGEDECQGQGQKDRRENGTVERMGGEGEIIRCSLQSKKRKDNA